MVESFRLILPFLIAFLAVLALGPALIRSLRRLGARQHVRDDGPATHLAKAGTPTMGGLLMLAALALAFPLPALLLARLRPDLIGLFGLTFLYGALGLADDYAMLRRRRSLGLKARYKLLAQAGIAALFLFSLPLLASGRIGLALPFTHRVLPLGGLYFPLAVLFILATSNAVNLTDGLDGLAAGLTLILAAALALYAHHRSDLGAAAFAAALAGACAGFLAFNLHPARIFMGDTGSLALGAALAGLALILRAELLFLIMGCLFFLEVLSVALQVASYQLTRRRIFRMSPLHHHFELCGIPETRIVYSAWALTALLSGLALWASHLRPGMGL